MTIWETVIQELDQRKWTRYELARKVSRQLHQRTVYRFVSGETDLATDKASIILEALDLEIRPKARKKRKEA